MKTIILLFSLCLWITSSHAFFNSSVLLQDLWDGDHRLEEAFEKYSEKAQYKVDLQTILLRGYTLIVKLKPSIESDAKVDLFTLYIRTWNQLIHYLQPVSNQLMKLFDSALDITWQVRRVQRQLNPDLDMIEIVSGIIAELSNVEITDELLLTLLDSVEELSALSDSVFAELDEIGQEFPNFDLLFLEYYQILEEMQVVIFKMYGYGERFDGFHDFEAEPYLLFNLCSQLLFLSAVTS